MYFLLEREKKRKRKKTLENTDTIYVSELIPKLNQKSENMIQEMTLLQTNWQNSLDSNAYVFVSCLDRSGISFIDFRI